VQNPEALTPRVLTERTSVVVTGGEGFLGSRVARRLAGLGCAVTSIDNRTSEREPRAGSSSGPQVNRVHADLRDRDAMQQAIERASPRFVFHLAALHYIPYCVADPVSTLEINAVGTQIVLDACATLPTVPTIVFASTADVYEPSTDPLSESAALGPNNVYGISKLTAERLVRVAGERQLCEPVICRLFNLFGAHETNPHVIPEIVNQLQAGDLVTLGNTTPKRDFVYVDDVADALVALSQLAPTGSVVNVGTGLSYSIDDVIETIAGLTGRAIEVVTDQSRWRASDRQNLQCDNQLLKSMVPDALPTNLADGLRTLLVEEGLLA
jgi:UDP-glucose 4-epimerase